MVEETAFLDIRPHLADLIVDLRLGKSCRFNHFLVENESAVIGQRTEPAFRTKREGYFPGNNEVEVCPYCQGDT